MRGFFRAKRKTPRRAAGLGGAWWALLLSANLAFAAETPSTCVTTGEDVVDPEDGLISLREAVAYAGTGTCGTEITFVMSDFSVCLAETLTLDKSLTITCLNQGITDYGGRIEFDCSSGPFFEIAAGATVTVRYGAFGCAGGHPFYNLGDLRLTSVSVSSNYDLLGGAVYNEGTLTMTGCSFSNTGAESGGALYNLGFATVQETSFSRCSADGGPGGAIYNAGDLILENVYFSMTSQRSFMEWDEALQMDVEVGIADGGALYNTGFATIDRATFLANACSGNGLAIANASNGVLQVNNAVFNLGMFWGDEESLTNGLPSSVWNDAGGSLTLVQSSFADQTVQISWNILGKWDELYYPYVGIAPDATATHILNCAFDLAETNALAGASNAVMRACAFAVDTNSLFTALLQDGGGMAQLALVPATNFNVRVPAVALRKTIGMLEWEEGTWQASGVQIPYWDEAALARDLLGTSRSATEAPRYPGALARAEHREELSSIVTTGDDIDDPTDGLISLREAFRYAALLAHVSAGEGGSAIEVSHDAEHLQCTLAQGPIEVDAPGQQVVYETRLDWSGVTPVTVDLQGTSRFLDIRSNSMLVMAGITVKNAACTEGGGAAVRMLEGGMANLQSCIFSNCVAAADGGALELGSNVHGWIWNCSFYNCQAGGDGGAMAAAGLVDGITLRCEDCSAAGRGGALCVARFGEDEYQHLGVFRRNHANQGGAVWVDAGVIHFGSFYDNVATMLGGAVAGAVPLVRQACFVRNTAPHGAAIYTTASPRTVVYNATFYDNAATEADGAAIEALTRPLRLGNCTSWLNRAGGASRLLRADLGVAVFNSLLPEVKPGEVTVRDAVTLLDFADDPTAGYLCEPDGTPSLGKVGDSVSLCPQKDLPATGITHVTRDDGSHDLAYFTGDEYWDPKWTDAEGESVTNGCNVTNDQFDRSRGAWGTWEQGIGSLAGNNGESSSDTVTTLTGDDDWSDGRITLNEAISYLHSQAEWPQDNGLVYQVKFDVTDTTNRVLKMTSEMHLTTASSNNFGEDKVLIVDGDCGDGTHVVIDLCGGCWFLDYSNNNNFIFRNLTFRNGGGSEPTFVFSDVQGLGVTGSVRFENCTFEDVSAYNCACVQSDKSVTFESCTFRNCSGSGLGALLYVSAPLVMTDCAFSGNTFAGGALVATHGGAMLRNCSFAGTHVGAGDSALLFLGDVSDGVTTNLVVNFAVSDTTWADAAAPGSLVHCGGSVTDFGNVTAGNNGGAAFCGPAGALAGVRLLNAVVDGAVNDATVEGDFQTSCEASVSRTVGTQKHTVCAPPSTANPGTPIAYYTRQNVTRLAVKTSTGWFGAAGTPVSGGEVEVVETDLFGQSRAQGGTGYPYYTCGALTDYTAGLVVTTEKDVVDANDGVVSLREAIEAARSGICQLSGARRITFSIPGVRNPVMALGATFELSDAAAFGDATPLEIYGSNRTGRVMFDGEGRYRIFHVGAGTRLVLADCTLMRGVGECGGAIRAEGGLELLRVTVSDSTASSLGGALYGADITAYDSTFEGCTSANNGGAVYVDEQGVFVGANLAFRANAATGYGSGGAIYVARGAGLELAGATFNANRAASDAPAVYADTYADVRLANASFAENIALDAAWETGTVFGYGASVDLKCVTSWGNTLAQGASLPVLDGYYATLTLADALVCESAASFGSVSETDTVRGAAASYFECTADEPITYGRSWGGVRHVFRVPSTAAIVKGTSVCADDLFGNARTNKTLGAVTYGGLVPAAETVSLARAGTLYVDLEAARLSLSEGAAVTSWPNAGTEGAFACVDASAGPTYQLRGGVPVVRFTDAQSILTSSAVIPNALAGAGQHTIELWVYETTADAQTIFALTPTAADADAPETALALGTTGVPGAWHYVVHTYDGVRSATYRDGRLVAARFGADQNLAGDGRFVLGGVWNRARAAYDQPFAGDVARVRVQGGCLTPEQVLANFTAENDTFARRVDDLAPVWCNAYWDGGAFADGASVNIMGSDVADVADQAFTAAGWQIDNGTLRLVRSNLAVASADEPKIVTGYGANHAAGVVVGDAAAFTVTAPEGTVFGAWGAAGYCRVLTNGMLTVTEGPLVIGTGAEPTQGALTVEAGGAAVATELQVGLAGAVGTVEIAGTLVVSNNVYAGPGAAFEVSPGGTLTLMTPDFVVEDLANPVPFTLNGGTLVLAGGDLYADLALTISGDAAIEVPAGMRVHLSAASITTTGSDVTLTKRGEGTLVIVPPVTGALQYYVEAGALDLASSLQKDQGLTVRTGGLYVPRQLSDCFVRWDAGVPAQDYYRLVTDRTDGLDLCDLFPFYRTDGLKGPFFGDVYVNGTVTHRDVTTENPFTIVAEPDTMVTLGADTGLEGLPLRVQGGGAVELQISDYWTATTNGLVFADYTALSLPALSVEGNNAFTAGLLDTEYLWMAYAGNSVTLALTNMTVRAETLELAAEDVANAPEAPTHGCLVLGTGAVVRTYGLSAYGEAAEGRVLFAGGSVEALYHERRNSVFFEQSGETGSMTVEAEEGHDIDLCTPARGMAYLSYAENLHLTGAGGLRKTGDGCLFVSDMSNAVLDYAGDTVFAEGEITIFDSVAFPTGAGKGDVILGPQTLLDVWDCTVSLNNLYDFGSRQTGADSVFVFGLGDVSTTLGTMFTGNETLRKEGTGTLDVRGTYCGDCEVNAGTVRLAAPQFRRYRLCFIPWAGNDEECAALAANLVFQVVDTEACVPEEVIRTVTVTNGMTAIELVFAGAQRVQRYQWARGAESVPLPSWWVFQGSDDGVRWTTLDTAWYGNVDTESLAWQTFDLYREMALGGTAAGTLVVDGCKLSMPEMEGAAVVLTNDAQIQVEDEGYFASSLSGAGSVFKTGSETLWVAPEAVFAPSGDIYILEGAVAFAAPDEAPSAPYVVPGLVHVQAGATLDVANTNGVAFQALRVDWRDCGTVTHFPAAAGGRLEITGVPAGTEGEFALPLTVHGVSGSFARWQVVIDGEEQTGLGVEYRDGALWVVAAAAPSEPIPELPANPTQQDVVEALEGSADASLATHLTTPEQYNAYRAWALTVETTSGEPAGQQTVKDSETAWLSYALNSAVLIPAPPVAGDLVIDTVEADTSAGAFDLTVSLEDVYVGEEATPENLAAVFGIEGATSLDGDSFSSANVIITFGTPVDGKVTVSVTPVDPTVTQFFIKVRLRN